MSDSASLRFPRYKIIRKIGEGAYASVYEAIHIRTNVQVAMKVFSKIRLRDPEYHKNYLREIDLLKRLDHPFLVTLFDIVQNDSFEAIVMEYVSGGSLLDFINSLREIHVSTARRLFQQLIIAIQFLHSKLHIVHRDIKAENILIDSHQNIRLIDFGFSRPFQNKLPLTTICGSPGYAAPELLLKSSYTQSIDIYSVGIILYAITQGHLPFIESNINKLLQQILSKEITFNPGTPGDLQDLILHMLDKNPDTRYTIDEIISHPWFQGDQCPYLHLLPPNQIYLENFILTELKSCGFTQSEIQSLPKTLGIFPYCEVASSYKILSSSLINVESYFSNTHPSRHITKQKHENISSLPNLKGFHKFSPTSPDSLLHRENASDSETVGINFQSEFSSSLLPESPNALSRTIEPRNIKFLGKKPVGQFRQSQNISTLSIPSMDKSPILKKGNERIRRRHRAFSSAEEIISPIITPFSIK